MNDLDPWTRASAVAEPLGIRLHPHHPSDDTGGDGSAHLPDGTELPVILKNLARWEFVPDAPVRPLVVQPYVNPRMAERYRDRGVFYVDLEGNAWVWTDSVKILVEGRRPSRESTPAARPGGLGTPSELRLAFVLLDDPAVARLGLREQADRAGISLGAAHAAHRRLRDRGILTSSRELRRTRELTDDWLAGFPSRLLPRLRGRRVGGAAPVDVVEAVSRRAPVFTAAGEAVSPTMSSQSSVAVYGTPPWTDLVRELHLKSEPDGPVTLREEFWNPASTNLSDRGRLLLTCGELIASDDERLRESAAELRRELP